MKLPSHPTKCIVYKLKDGRTRKVSPVFINKEETADECLERVVQHELSRSDKDGDLYIIDLSVVPDREFRDAWDINETGFNFDLDKAKTIGLERIRAARNEKWIDFDRRYSQAERDNEDLTALNEERLVLKGATDALKNLTPTSIDDIKLAYPEMLK